ncbi:MAG TPA: DUF4124 domain-containing protein [Candidatus Binatia bacterium]|nr:DUF4124 domain-containing protein [Candidatus Binatia bacterium]
MDKRIPSLSVFLLACLIAAATAGSAAAGDYYAYRDASGRLVLSNSPPPASGKTIVKETLPDVSQQEVAEARARDEAAAVDNRITNLENTVDDLEYRLRNQPVADYAQPAYGDNSVFVGVANSFVWPAHRPPRPRPNPNPMRSTAPPSTLPGGIIPGGSLPGGKMG